MVGVGAGGVYYNGRGVRVAGTLPRDYTLLFVLDVVPMGPSATPAGFRFSSLSQGLGSADIISYERVESTFSPPTEFTPDRQHATGNGNTVTIPGPNGTADITVDFAVSGEYTVEAIHVVGRPQGTSSGGATPTKGSGSVGPALSPVAIPTYFGTRPLVVVGASAASGATSGANISVAETASPAASQTVTGGTDLPVALGGTYYGSMSYVYEVPLTGDPGFEMAASSAPDFETGFWWAIGLDGPPE